MFISFHFELINNRLQMEMRKHIITLQGLQGLPAIPFGVSYSPQKNHLTENKFFKKEDIFRGGKCQKFA